jgi:hypothetical protein
MAALIQNMKQATSNIKVSAAPLCVIAYPL